MAEGTACGMLDSVAPSVKLASVAPSVKLASVAPCLTLRPYLTLLRPLSPSMAKLDDMALLHTKVWPCLTLRPCAMRRQA